MPIQASPAAFLTTTVTGGREYLITATVRLDHAAAAGSEVHCAIGVNTGTDVTLGWSVVGSAPGIAPDHAWQQVMTLQGGWSAPADGTATLRCYDAYPGSTQFMPGSTMTALEVGALTATTQQ